MNLIKEMKKNWALMFMFLLPLLWYITFCYVPMYGIQIAFRNFNPAKGYLGSTWVGFEQFRRFFSSYYSIQVIKNTVLLSLYSVIFGFPVPILLALMINEIKSTRYKKVVQNITYIPHFLSVVVVCGMLYLFLSPQYGVVNNFLLFLKIDPIAFMESEKYFRGVFIISGIWQTAGWSSIIYIAALAGISPTLYEAATIDGASRFRKMKHVSIPGIAPTIITLLILRIGQLMSVGFEKALLLQNDLNLGTSEIISTLVYKNGILQGDFSYATAVGLMNSIINLVLIILANKISRKFSENSLW
ncbi:MAG: ABC transporter permease [Lachnospirales bacterium]